MPIRRSFFLVFAALACAVILAACYGGDGYNDYSKGPSAPGGATSVDEYGQGAFSQPAQNLSSAEVARFRVGDTFFTDSWVAAPGATPDRDGLGPTYLATSCADCHVRDGRSSAPGSGTDESIGVLRFVDDAGQDVVLDDYHEQLQAYGIPGVPAEGSARIEWVEVPGQYPDGTPFTLRKPQIVMSGRFSNLDGRTADSVRLGPPLIGLGLLEAIPEADILAIADESDSDDDGVSGRAHWLPGDVLGRFGHKANVATVEQQTAIAYLLDMGITSPLLPNENCPVVQVACAAKPSGGSPEIGQDRFDDVVFYTQTLAVPSRPFAGDESVVQGETLFGSIGCDACHIRTFETGDHAIAALSGQTIYPYTDLLLHDMGPGLSDGRKDGDAEAAEWKTPALWGLGLTRAVNSSAGFLHDGRARSIEEAILWHGGEAETSRDRFTALSAEDRELVLIFLKSL